MFNHTRDGDAGHDEIFGLLPWYANRSLASDQRGRVSRHVNRCAECQAELRLLTMLNETVQQDADAQYRRHADVAGSLASVMGRIDAEADRSPAAEPWLRRFRRRAEGLVSLPRSLPGSLLSVFPLAPPAARWGAAAVAGVLVAVIGVQLHLGQAGSDSAADDYTVLSSPAADASSLRLSVQPASAADLQPAESVIRDELDRLGLASDIEPDGQGGYTVTLREPIAIEALNDVMGDLEGQALIERVRVLP